MPTILALATVALVAVSMATDVRTRRIPNAVPATAVVAALVLQTLDGGAAGAGASLAGLLLAGGALVVPFALGGVGAGDVKMMAAVGALLGPSLAVRALLLGMALGGVVMLLHVAALGRAGEKVRATARMLGAAAAQGSLAPLRAPAADPSPVTLPYSVPLGAGTLAVVAGATVGLWSS
jgi:prepilin peptidase CpaA